jgi:hypothetical protein
MDLPLAVRRRVIERAEKGEKDLGLAAGGRPRRKGVSATT